MTETLCGFCDYSKDIHTKREWNNCQSKITQHHSYKEMVEEDRIMSQSAVDDIRVSIIKRRELEILLLKKKRDNINDEIKTQKEYLKAYKKTVPTVEILE